MSDRDLQPLTTVGWVRLVRTIVRETLQEHGNTRTSRAAVVYLTAMKRGIGCDVDRVREATGYEHAFVSDVAFYLRRSGLWTDEGVVDDGLLSGDGDEPITLALIAMVGTGELIRERRGVSMPVVPPTRWLEWRAAA